MFQYFVDQQYTVAPKQNSGANPGGLTSDPPLKNNNKNIVQKDLDTLVEQSL